MAKSTLYIIQGFIASGKTTFSKNIAMKTNSVHLNPDEWVTKFFSEEEYFNNWYNCFDITISRLWKCAEEYLIKGKSVVFDMGFWLKNDRLKAKEIANKCCANFIHYYLYVPDEILKERIIKTRPKKWADVHIRDFEKNKQKFDVPTNDENAIVINNF